MRKLIPIVALTAVVSVVWIARGRGESGTAFRFVTVSRSDVESTVSSTGTLEAVTTVSVGTQVSGIVSRILVDFNDAVWEGQILAVLDTTLLEIAVRDAGAGLARADADLAHATRELARIRGMYERGSVSESELSDAEYARDVALASHTSAAIDLERAERNLDYATIRAPISGTVIERNVDVGQTVAASLSAPQLFLIANDLSHLHILVSVDEADIGSVRAGQTVRFNVQAYPDDTFAGVVSQVRLQSTTEDNVVSYTAVVEVANADGRLLPGMTATADFVVDRTTGVLTVPNAALRFRPTEDMLAEIDRSAGTSGGAAGDSSSDDTPNPDDVLLSEQSGRAARLYTVDADGRVDVIRVRTGLTDGTQTVVQSNALTEGMPIVAGVTTSTGSSSANPFQTQQEGSRRPGPPGASF